MIPAGARLHFVGIGGSGMSAIAQVLLSRGFQVSGCDLRDGHATARLRRMGADVVIGHSATHLEKADVLVYTRAVDEGSQEIQMARARGMPALHRAEVLGQIMDAATGLAVVGTHGKTTTAAMLARILIAGGLDPTVLVGAYVPELESNARTGGSSWIVAEVDESDGSLVHVVPWGVVLTSLDVTDHRDFYQTPSSLEQTFARFLASVDPRGFVAACIDHPRVRTLAGRLRRSVATYGFAPDADVRGTIVESQGRQVRAAVSVRGTAVGELVLQSPGRHNVSNALGALAAASEVGVPAAKGLDALAGFQGVGRRFEIRGEADGVMVVDDYAHNPVKVAAVLEAARAGWPQRRLIVLFQPHRFSRTRTTYAEYAHAFDEADDLVVTEIYAADEPPQSGVTASLIVEAVAPHRPVHYEPSLRAALDLVEHLAAPGAIVLTLGAGDIGQAGETLLRRLTARAARAGGPASSGARGEG